MKRDHRKMAQVTMVECAICGGRSGLARHHIVPRSLTQQGSDDPENLIVTCATDHRRIHAKEIDLGIHITPSQGAKSVLLLGTVYAAWQLLYPSESRATSGVSWPE